MSNQMENWCAAGAKKKSPNVPNTTTPKSAMKSDFIVSVAVYFVRRHLSKMNLFQKGNFTLASGFVSPYKIDCDALTEDDLECIAYLLYQKLTPFGTVVGVPTGGERLARAMQPYKTPGSTTWLIVDDVFTTGKSMWEFIQKTVPKQENGDDWAVSFEGAVIFARNPPHHWIESLFQM